jgi:hypothetical protein
MTRFAISAAILCTAIPLSGAAHAMEIKDYFKMADQDQGRFNQMLLDSAEKALRNEGRSDVAMQLDDLFTVIKPGDQISDGFNEYLANLGDMLRAEVKREATNPNRPSLQAERAFRDVAQDHGINLPPQFETIAASFRRQLPFRDLAK